MGGKIVPVGSKFPSASAFLSQLWQPTTTQPARSDPNGTTASKKGVLGRILVVQNGTFRVAKTLEIAVSQSAFARLLFGDVTVGGLSVVSDDTATTEESLTGEVYVGGRLLVGEQGVQFEGAKKKRLAELQARRPKESPASPGLHHPHCGFRSNPACSHRQTDPFSENRVPARKDPANLASSVLHYGELQTAYCSWNGCSGRGFSPTVHQPGSGSLFGG